MMTTTHAAHVIVLGNEKGGSGKSTIALHLAIGLMELGFRITIADFDERQRSLQRYLENRRVYTTGGVRPLPCPRIYEPSLKAGGPLNAYNRINLIADELHDVCKTTDFLIIDTPGSVTDVARLAHRFADTLITPINDSLIDLDVLARLGSSTGSTASPSQYSYLVLEERQRRLADYGAGIDWIVVRNRIASIASANNERVGDALQNLSPKLGFRIAPGVSERVIFRELFLIGATVLDPIDVIAGARVTMSHLAARIEVRQLIEALWLPQLTRTISSRRHFITPPSERAVRIG